MFDTQQTENIDVYSQALPRLVGAGMRIPTSWAHDKLRIPEAEKDKPILQIADLAPRNALSLSANASRQTAACGIDHSEDAPDTLDHLAVLGMAGWQPAFTDMLAPVQEALAQAIASGQTLQQFQQALPQLLKQMDVEQIADPLARASFTAYLAGASGLEP